MRMCDRHPRTRATDEIHLRETDQRFDLCGECATQIEEFISDTKKEAVEEQPKRRGFFKRDSAQAG